MLNYKIFPYISYNVLRKYYSENLDIDMIKIWSKSSIILPFMIDSMIHVYNGRMFMPLQISDSMVGHKIGEFVFTRLFRAHKKISKKLLIKK